MWSATQPFTGERSCTSALPFLIREEQTEAKPPAQATFKKIPVTEKSFQT